ncbi:hypothetical protein ACXET9_05885 [Brachybacterium sp. DNPG3]
MTDPKLQAILTAVAGISEEEFAVDPTAVRGRIGEALLAAVFSVRPRFQKEPCAQRAFADARTLVDTHPAIADDLRALAELDADQIAAVMGPARDGARPKAQSVLDAAHALLSLDPAVATASDLRRQPLPAVQQALQRIGRQGAVATAHIPLLAGHPQASTGDMLRRFVDAVLSRSGLDVRGADGTRQAIAEEDAVAMVRAACDTAPRGVSAEAFEHAVWREHGAARIQSNPWA